MPSSPDIKPGSQGEESENNGGKYDEYSYAAQEETDEIILLGIWRRIKNQFARFIEGDDDSSETNQNG